MPPRSLPHKAVQAFGNYLKAHPEEVVRAAKSATRLKLGLPLAAVRWLLRELGGEKTPRDLHIEARAPGIFISASVVLMKTDLKVSSTVVIEDVDFRPDALLVNVRLRDLDLQVAATSEATPIAALLRSGALNLSRPGDLVSYLPKQPPFLLEAKGDRFTLDLLRLPQLSRQKARTIVAALTPLVGVSAVQGADDHIDIAFDPLPEGAARAFEQLKKLF